MINYKEEVKRLNEFVPGDQTEFWKPKPGQYRVRALSELEETKPFQGDVNKPQIKIDLLLGEEKFTWTMAKGKSPGGSYGQLCNLALKKGKLTNIDFMIVVTNDKKKNTYTIVEL